MYIVLNASNGKLVEASSVLSNEVKDNSDYIIGECSNENFDPSYSWTITDGVAVKGDLLPVDTATIAALEAERLATLYQESRRESYPQIAEQLDKLYHDIESGTLDQTGKFFTALKAVKDANPKP